MICPHFVTFIQLKDIDSARILLTVATSWIVSPGETVVFVTSTLISNFCPLAVVPLSLVTFAEPQPINSSARTKKVRDLKFMLHLRQLKTSLLFPSSVGMGERFFAHTYH